MEERNTSAIVYGHQGERRARDRMLVTQSARDALGEVRLSHTETTGKHKNVTIGEKRRDNLAKALCILLRSATISQRRLPYERHQPSSGRGNASALCSASTVLGSPAPWACACAPAPLAG